MTKIVTVAAAKGGVGKTTVAYELAWLLGAPLVDLDWDRGGATRQWGYRHEAHVRAPLLDALDSGRTPRLVRAARKPSLLPCHPDFAVNQPEPDALATALERWAQEWGSEYVVIDTHPGGVPSTFGAMAAASVVVTPAVLATKELEALEGMLDEMADYPIMVVPNKVPVIPPAREIERLGRITQAAGVQVGPPISEYRWLSRRQIRVAVTSYDPEPLRVQPLSAELRKLAATVRSYTRSYDAA